MKRAVFIGTVLCIVLFQIYSRTLGAKIIGSASGPEWESLTIDGKTYTIDNSNNFSTASRGRFLGIVVAGDTTFRIYSVKGDDEGRCLYRLWDWEGAFYRLEDPSN